MKIIGSASLGHSWHQLECLSLIQIYFCVTREPVTYLPSFGSERTFDRWKLWASGNGLIRKVKHRWYLQDVALSETLEIGTASSGARLLGS